jgi:hypothetical protein
MIFLGTMIIMMSLFTDYESGIVRSLPVSAHLNIDIGTGLVFAASPWLFGFADQVYLPHLIMGLFQTIASLLTSRTVPGNFQEEVPVVKQNDLVK